MLARLALAAALALLAPPARADRPGEFDYYLLALSIAPSFCALEGGHKRQCRDARDADYRAVPLTVHGLWPNKKGRRGADQPQSCAREPLGRLPAELRQKLDTYMPGVKDGLEGYQWGKHGVCSGLAPEAYFARVVALAEQANAAIGPVLKEHLGRPLRIDELLAAVGRRNPALAQAIQVDCRFSRKQGGGAQPTAYVAEIRVLVSKDLERDPDRDGWPGTFVPLSEAGFRPNSGCPGGAGLLPGGYERG